MVEKHFYLPAPIIIHLQKMKDQCYQKMYKFLK
jgi:hypothetical protein